MTTDVIGSGWTFPLGTTASGGVALSGGHAKVAQALRLVLGTAKGERPMRPEFGCGIHELVFDPADQTLLGRVENEVTEAVLRWEPRIELVGVLAELDPADAEGATILITVRYLLSDTDDERSLVFPFYSLPEE